MDRIELRCGKHLHAILLPAVNAIEVSCRWCRAAGEADEGRHWYDAATGEPLTHEELTQRAAERAA